MKKILVIEDNWEIRENVKEILDISNYEVITASNGKDGLEATLDHSPDLILCDIMMPVMNGYELIQILKATPSLEYIPVIFLTAKSEPVDYKKGIALGASDIIIKPFDGSDLLNVVKKFLNHPSSMPE